VDKLQKQREEREQERAKWDAINQRARLRELARESVTEYGTALFTDNAERVTIALGLLLEELLANPSKPGPYFSAWPLLLMVTNRGPRTLAAIAIGVVLDHISQRPSERKLAGAIGRALQDELKAGRIEQLSPDLLRLIRKRKGNRALSSKQVLDQLRLDVNGWAIAERTQVGGLLLQVIAANSNLIRVETGIRNGRSRKTVLATDEALAVIKANPPRPLPARRLPKMYGGGHLNNDDPLVRSRAGYDLSHLSPEAMAPLVKVVNALQQQELRIDPEMVQLQRCAWDHNIRGLFPVTRDPLPEPPKPQELVGSEEYRRWLRQKAAAQYDRNQNALQRRRIEETIRQCEEVAGQPIWFAYCLDFRYRIYSSNRYATHQGPDWEKAAINFAAAEQCSVEAFEWMLKAAAGHYGVAKNWRDRLSWGQEHLPQICAVAEAPLDRLELWRDAKDPWQYLQICRAIAQQVADPNSSCSVPVRFDQTCSGIGIAAALMRDRRLARLTNINGKIRKDIYGHVAEEVLRLLRLDLSNGTPSEVRMAELWLEFGIGRNLTKGPVMTTIYGAQFLSIVDGLVAALEERKAGLRVSEWELAYLMPARYLARKISLLLGSELKSCLELQTWLRNASKKALANGSQLEWTNPLGVPMRLGDQLDPRTTVTSLAHGKRRWQAWNNHADNGELSALSTNRAVTANVVHHFDAALCHIMVSMGSAHSIPLLTNHDCFATIPSQAGWLHHTLHDQLRVLYATDWLDDMSQQIRSAARLSNFKRPPTVGDLCPGEIGSNPHCFS